ncbi:MAG: S-layer homology domain-containing protein, partial [Oscillospiraceae bacterium]|nr:S-layer homology domain-containing protein [Oscillospiraceae bacterium]
MKKLLSLLLAVVMLLGVLTVTASADDVEMPPECDADSAGVMVTCTGNSETYVFETLSPEVIKWTCAMLPGNKTITVKKDLELSNPGEEGNIFLEVPGNTAGWYEKKGDKDCLEFDLDGHTITYHGASNLIYAQRYGFELKDGTILYTCEGNTRNIITLGSSAGQAATTNGQTVWTPKITLSNVKLFNLTEKGGGVFGSFLYAPRLTVKNSTLWSKSYSPLILRKSTQKSQNTPYEGDYDVQITVSNSVIGSGDNYPITAIEPIKVTLADSILVTNKDGKAFEDDMVDMTVKGDGEAVDESWTEKEVGVEMTGTALKYGAAAKPEPLPFTDVAESDWFYSFVKQMYTKKIISGMTATTFVPNGTLTYGQALKLLVAAIDTDVGNASSGHWASNYLAKAKEKGWIDGDVDLDGKI